MCHIYTMQCYLVPNENEICRKWVELWVIFTEISQMLCVLFYICVIPCNLILYLTWNVDRE